MSKEKRFVQSKYAHHLQDTKTDMHYYLTSERIGCTDLFDEIERLTEENERLRQFITKGRRLSVKELMNTANENELLKKKIRVLEKENENLESNIKFFSNQLKKLRG